MMRWLSVTACVALGVGCAGAPPVPPERFTNADTDIKAAQELGAANNPQGRTHLQTARDQLEAAKKLNKDEPAVAARKLDNAEAEAELAKAVTREQATRAEADTAKAKLSAVQQGTGGGQ